MRGVKTGGGEGIVWWRLQMEMAMDAKDSGALLLAAAAASLASWSRPVPLMLSASTAIFDIRVTLPRMLSLTVYCRVQ
jgi:hypothetical protein